MTPVRYGSSWIARLLRMALVGAVLASGSPHFHSGEPVTAERGAAQRIEFRSTSSHPKAPLHIESVGLERAPRCLECLLRQKNHALGAAALTLSTVELSLVDTHARARASVLERTERPGRPRGPPRV
jgi:hypothetical protein